MGLMNRLIRVLPVFFIFGLLYSPLAGTVVLKASKDNFSRSNERTRNSGASTLLYVAHAPVVRTLVGFDLSGVTNRIEEAVFRFRQSGDNVNPVVLTVAPMVHTEGNAGWAEGAGALGATGQNAREGESCYGWRAFPDRPWERSSGKAAVDLSDAALWNHPLVSGKRVPWEAAAWVEIGITDLALLEEIRTSDSPFITLGLWGTSGSGLYAIASRESGFAPELILQVIEEEKKPGAPPPMPLLRSP